MKNHLHLCHNLWSKFFIATFIVSTLALSYQSQAENKSPSTLQTKALANVKLPNPVYSSHTSIEEALKKRRSIREYKNNPITLQQLAQLLWAAQGITSAKGFRTAPSAGALYPIEIYVLSGNVKGLMPGVYRYLPKKHVLELLAKDDIRSKLATATFNQSGVTNAAADILITAAYARTTAKYGNRGERFAQMEAGQVAENICLQVTSLGLGTVTIGVFNDSKVKALMNFSKDEYPLYIMPVGKI